LIFYSNFVVFRVSKDFHPQESIILSKGQENNFNPNSLLMNFIEYYRYTWCLAGRGRVILHNPKDSPRIAMNYQKMTTFYKVSSFSEIVMTPVITSTELELRKVDVGM
jgi:hypothetical protein